MAISGANGQRSHIYLGLAGETGRGRVVQSGLYRLADGSERMGGACSAASPRRRRCARWPCIRCTPRSSTPARKSGRIAATIAASTGKRSSIPDHGLPVWSFLFHPYDPDVMFVGYENCEIYRSDDAGERWTASAGQRALPRDHHGDRAPTRQSGC